MSIKVVWKSADGSFSSGIGLKLPDAVKVYMAARTALAGSKTAQEILKYVDGHATEIQLVVCPGAEGEMLFPGELQGLNTPTVIWDPNKYFLFYSNVAKVHNVVYADLNSYQPAIVLIHELGHAKQWLSNPAQHEARFKRGPEGIAEIEAENLAIHEGPVAQELGLPVRKHYKHFPNSGEIPSSVKLLHEATVGPNDVVTKGARNKLT
jgi:hypothetical protein